MQVPLPNGISFHPVALAGCMSVTDDIQTDRPCYGNICRNRQNCFQQRCLKITLLMSVLFSNSVVLLFALHSWSWQFVVDLDVLHPILGLNFKFHHCKLILVTYRPNAKWCVYSTYKCHCCRCLCINLVMVLFRSLGLDHVLEFLVLVSNSVILVLVLRCRFCSCHCFTDAR